MERGTSADPQKCMASDEFMTISSKHQHQHIQSNHFVEALTLRLHTDLHKWNLMTFANLLPDLNLPSRLLFGRKHYHC